jgi:hypothetical protein
MGFITLKSDIPEDFIEVNSLLSAKFPIVIMDENKTAIGRAKGMRFADVKSNSFNTIWKSTPFPMISSMYFHTNCINKNSMAITKVITKGPMKDLIINVLIFLIKIGIN